MRDCGEGEREGAEKEEERGREGMGWRKTVSHRDRDQKSWEMHLDLIAENLALRPG